MGECGCGEITDYKAVAVGDAVLVLEIYHGCRYCKEGIGVSLNAFTREGAKRFFGEDFPELIPDEYGESMIAVPLIEPKDLLVNKDALEDIKNYDTVEDWISDYGLDLIQSALQQRRRAFEEEDKRDMD